VDVDDDELAKRMLERLEPDALCSAAEVRSTRVRELLAWAKRLETDGRREVSACRAKREAEDIFVYAMMEV
jgi:hypothetical protein